MTHIQQTIKQSQQVFNNYFSLVGGKKFRQFYYDWHIDQMMAPFAGMVVHFSKTYGTQAESKFAEFVDDVSQSLQNYNNDKPQLSLLKTLKYTQGNTKRLTSLLEGMETFGFDFRQFIYSFASKKDHDQEFGGWLVKMNMPYSNHHGLLVGRDVLQFLKQNFSQINNGGDTYQRALYAADTFLRQNIVKDYQYGDNYNFANRRKIMKQLRQLRNQLDKEFQQMPDSSELREMFQVEECGLPPKSDYLANGFELEFYVPEEFGDYGKLISYLKEKNSWDALYSSNKDPQAYQNPASAGVIMRDESLTRYNNLSAVEYASSIMRNKEDEQRCLKIFDSFDKGPVNVHCSLHQHLSAEGFTLPVYQRLVKRMMQHEAQMVGAFAAPERQENKLLYATYISRNLSSNGKRDYPLLCVMVDLCDNKKQLEEMSAFGHKYKTLNILPEKTVEIRFMNANFNKKFVQAFLHFNREFVGSAVANAPQHLNYPMLSKYSWHNNQESDKKTIQLRLPYRYQVAYDSYNPMHRYASKEVVNGEQTYARLVMHALNETQKFKLVNTGYINRLRGGNTYGR